MFNCLKFAENRIFCFNDELRQKICEDASLCLKIDVFRNKAWQLLSVIVAEMIVILISKKQEKNNTELNLPSNFDTASLEKLIFVVQHSKLDNSCDIFLGGS